MAITPISRSNRHYQHITIFNVCRKYIINFADCCLRQNMANLIEFYWAKAQWNFNVSHGQRMETC